MCGRYYYSEKTEKEIERQWKFEKSSFTMRVGDVTPGSSPVVLSAAKLGNGGGIKASNMFWGLARNDKRLVINARIETAFDKPMFSDSMEHRRCIVPAAGFYEWNKDRNKVSFYRKDGSTMYLAGFYQLSDNKESFAILTTAANESMIKVHDRMPLMIEADRVKDWLWDNDAARKMLSMKMPFLESYQDYEQLSLF